MKSCLVLRHLAFEDLGLLASILKRRDFDYRYIDIGVDTLDHEDVMATDLLIVLGAPIGVHDEEKYPYLKSEQEAIRTRVWSSKPILGICLGAQLMALALGAAVAPALQKEIGFGEIALTSSGKSSPLRHLNNKHVLHWHGENFDLPAGAVSLASSKHCPCQAFSKGKNLLGLQFHLEVDFQFFERWLIGHTVELANAGVNIDAVRDDVEKFGGELTDSANKIFEEWLDEASL